MGKKLALLGLLGAMTVGLSGCFSATNWDENVRMINHWGSELDDMRHMTNHYFFDYDKDNPFED